MEKKETEKKINALIRGYLSSSAKLTSSCSSASSASTSSASSASSASPYPSARIFPFVPWERLLAGSRLLLLEGFCYLEIRLESQAKTKSHESETGWNATFLLKVGCSRQKAEKSFSALSSKLCLYPSAHLLLHHQQQSLASSSKIASSRSVVVPTAEILVQVGSGEFFLSVGSLLYPTSFFFLWQGQMDRIESIFLDNSSAQMSLSAPNGLMHPVLTCDEKKISHFSVEVRLRESVGQVVTCWVRLCKPVLHPFTRHIMSMIPLHTIKSRCITQSLCSFSF